MAIKISNNTIIDDDRVVVNAHKVGIGTTNPASELTVVGDATISSLNSGPLAGQRNIFINGDFEPWNKLSPINNDSASALIFADNWNWLTDYTGVGITFSQEFFDLGQTVVPGNPKTYARLDKYTVGTGGTYELIYNFNSITDVELLSGDVATFSFWAKTPSSCSINSIIYRQGFVGGSSNVDTTITNQTIALTSGWTKYSYTYTIPSVSGKNIGVTTTSNNYEANKNGLIQININIAHANPYILDIAQIQIEKGPVATPYEKIPNIEDRLTGIPVRWLNNSGGYELTSKDNGRFIALWTNYSGDIDLSEDIIKGTSVSIYNASGSTVLLNQTTNSVIHWPADGGTTGDRYLNDNGLVTLIQIDETGAGYWVLTGTGVT